MPDYRSLYDNKYLYFFDLKGRDVTVTIAAVKGAKLIGQGGKESKKPVLYFKESHDDRGFAICKTDGRTIAAMYGPLTEDWIGKRITLFATQCDAFGKLTDCIRVRPAIPKEKTPAGSFAEPPFTPPSDVPGIDLKG